MLGKTAKKTWKYWIFWRLRDNSIYNPVTYYIIQCHYIRSLCEIDLSCFLVFFLVFAGGRVILRFIQEAWQYDIIRFFRRRHTSRSIHQDVERPFVNSFKKSSRLFLCPEQGDDKNRKGIKLTLTSCNFCLSDRQNWLLDNRYLNYFSL